ncbi:ABC transporter ATP-binding protein [Gorillibacterium sp. CAU 1737]|uniref:ABC transporter ATP-binding protein n=1 Tax=Gorillibacterium sp. CAU 1737 TaxID=3140362 RepID=UPI003261ACD2
MLDKPTVVIKGLTKKIGSRLIIDDLNFEVPKGEVFGFLGPNGAGKTTTIRMMVGLMKPTFGDVWIEGKSIRHEFEQAIRHVGAIVENPEMYKYLSGYKNLIHYARMIPGISMQRIDEVVRLVGLDQRIHDKVKSYSLGMRQRLGVAQALLHKPNLLILDEPTNGLDPAGIRELRDYLRQLAREEGISIVVSSHLLAEMELMCDRIGIIQKGKLVDVQLIQDFVTEGEEERYWFRISSPDEAALVIEGMGITAVRREQGLELAVTGEQAADVNEQLVKAGIRVYGFHPVKKSLEDKFLEMTGGETHV